MKKRSIFCAVFCATLLAICLSTQLFAAEYAYSIGVNHGLFGTLTGNFTGNVEYAATVYGGIDDIDHSYYNFAPTRDYMFGNNENGERRIASKIVFLNGHANYDHIAFNKGNEGGEYATGVIWGYDDTAERESGYKYVGLKSTDMKTCSHISFVGCSTGDAWASDDQSCIARRAYWEGANSALGFKNEIHSRNSRGPQWLEVFNDYLANGYTIAECITAATTAEPNSDLGDYAIVWGYSTNRVTTSNSTASIYSAENESLYEKYGIVKLTPNAMCSNDVVLFETSLNMDAFENSSMDKVAEYLDTYMDAYVEDFDINDYKVIVNMFGTEENVGFIKLIYCLDNNIETNKAYVISIENGIVCNVSANTSMLMAENMDESNVANFETALDSHTNKAVATIDTAEYLGINDTIISVQQKFVYDYRTGKLTAIDSVFYTAAELDDAIVDHSVETILNDTWDLNE